jgi:hypothetical protein
VQHEKRVTLFRLLPFPAYKRVTVGRITVRGFREAVKIGLSRLLEFAAEHDGKPTEAEAQFALGDPATTAALADLICIGQPRGFFRRWHSQRNASRVIEASWEVENDPGWARMLALIDWTGERVKKGGGLVMDIAALCKLYSLTPLDVLTMPMQDFLDLCDCVSAGAKAARDAEMREDPTLDPEAEPTALHGLGNIGGKVYVN